ncbi:MAG: hypothetical protein CSA76_00055 [Spirochaetales bacterium]|nr:MAG: hypothetical protein CSA76_00055 [Spirochaetales bacterium]
MRKLFRAGCVLSAAFLLILSSCTADEINIPPSLRGSRDLQQMLRIARQSASRPAVRYAALEPVISRYRAAGEIKALNALLGRFLQENPGDPYGAYYLMAMAEGARDTGSKELSLDYMRRLLKNYPDLEIAGRSLHLLAMAELARNTDSPREAIAMRMEMQQRFFDRIDPGRNLYALAGEYRKIGNWDAMYAAYRNFLDYPQTVIPGNPDAAYEIGKQLEFHNSSKYWTMNDLDELVRTVKYAIRTRDAALLKRYQAEDFFLMSWTQRTSDDFTHTRMNLGSFLQRNIRYRSELESFSNDREAYLWSAGWSWKIPTWYLYFRKIDYPADPEINGRWEWAGIYFGERL